MSLDKASTYGFKAHSTMHWVSPIFLFLVHLVLDFDTYSNSSALLFYSFEVAFILSMFLSKKTTYFMVVSMWCLPTILMWLFKLPPSAIILFDDSHMQGIKNFSPVYKWIQIAPGYYFFQLQKGLVYYQLWLVWQRNQRV